MSVIFICAFYSVFLLAFVAVIVVVGDDDISSTLILFGFSADASVFSKVEGESDDVIG